MPFNDLFLKRMSKESEIESVCLNKVLERKMLALSRDRVYDHVACVWYTSNRHRKEEQISGNRTFTFYYPNPCLRSAPFTTRSTFKNHHCMTNSLTGYRGTNTSSCTDASTRLKSTSQTHKPFDFDEDNKRKWTR